MEGTPSGLTPPSGISKLTLFTQFCVVLIPVPLDKGSGPETLRKQKGKDRTLFCISYNY